jgi:hypothetical protein
VTGALNPRAEAVGSARPRRPPSFLPHEGEADGIHLPCPTVRASHQWLPRGAVLLRTCLPDIFLPLPGSTCSHQSVAARGG